MYLKSLEIIGFKSFPDKTIINFQNGITAIVGPNGSGKSNISDALRWVLGEQSTKNLRGSKMEDVIFGGTKNRKPQGFAEVSLTIDNTDRALDMDYNEITVTRRYYRSGDSDYFINKTAVRLKDINELFMDTGLGKDGYSIIGQGKIAEILSSKGEDRRQILEEASGISKFRYRKLEAQRRLNSTNENLIRLKDIIVELTERKEILEAQAEKAQEYLKLRDEKKVLEINLWLNNIERNKEFLEKADEKVNAAQQDVDNSTKQLENLAKKVDDAYRESGEITTAIEVLNEEVKALELSKRDIENTISIIENDIKFKDENIEKLQNEIEEFQGRTKEIQLKIDEKNKIIEDLCSDKVRLDKEFDALMEEQNQLLIKNSAHEKELEELNIKLIGLTTLRTDIKVFMSSKQSALESMSSKLEFLSSQVEEKEKEKALRKSALSELKEKKESILEEIEGLSNVLRAYEMKMEKQKEDFEKIQSKLSKTEREFLDSQNKLKLFIDMENHFEGFAKSVKTVMNDSKNGILKGVIGTVSSVIKVSGEYSLAIETALGGALQNIITETSDNAKQAIYHLKNRNAGRCTFLPIDNIKGEKIKLEKGFGVIGIACELLDYDNKFDGIIKNLLGRCVVVDNIDNALKTAKANNFRYKCVTLDGQVINAGGSMTGGSAVSNVGLLTRKNEIENLSKVCKNLEKEYEDLKAKSETFKEEVSKITALTEGSISEKREFENELSIIENEISSVSAYLLNINAEADALIKQKEESLLTVQLISEEISAKEKEQDKNDSEISLLESKISEFSQSNEEFNNKRNEIANNLSSKRLEIFDVEKNIDLEKANIESLKLTISNDEKSIGTKKADIESAISEKEEKKKEIEALKEKIIGSDNAISDCKEKIQQKIKDRENCELQVTNLRREEKDEGVRKEELIRQLEKAQNKKIAVQNEYDVIIAKLWDEYELTLSESMQFKTEIQSVSAATSRIAKLRSQLKNLGDVNVAAIEEFKQVKERYDFLTVQIDDLDKAKADLEMLINELTSNMKNIFKTQFAVINENFGKVFKEFFDGGTAALKLKDPQDILNSDIEIEAQPPGKVIKNISSLSGGEQALVAISLYFAILKVRPTPFCIVDEIEAALDDANVFRYAAYLRKLSSDTQFVAITHRRGTMEEADVLYGVTMQEKGVSKMLTINVNEFEKQFKI
ncbi:MAG: chromosome segregation protein SMC [Clostridia bacterium]|nr:chromosome segregation protein SMC [Clostridia bacterium]